MLTGGALGCCVTGQFYSMKLWLCRGQSPRGQAEWVHPFSCVLSGVSLLSTAVPNSRTDKKKKYFSATYSRVTLNL